MQFIKRGLNDFNKLTTIPLELREKLKSKISFNNSKIIKTHKSSDGTLKFLVRLPVETKLSVSIFLKKREALYVYPLR